MSADRLKFRVWDKAENKYNRFPFHLAMSGELDRLSVDGELLATDEDRFIVEQCTGGKDRNGNLIYEGDLLGESKEDDEFIEICWCDTLASFMYDIFPETYGNLETCHADYLAKFEIIGNIHEDQFRDLTELMESEVEDE